MMKTLLKSSCLLTLVFFLQSCSFDFQGNKSSRGFVNLGTSGAEAPSDIGTGTTRPTGVTLDNVTYCICQNNETAMISGCESFCSDKDDASPTLYLNTSLSADISLNTETFGSLFKWCTAETETEINPSCVLTYYSSAGPGDAPIEVNLSETSNSLTADLVDLDRETIYVMKLEIPQYGYESENSINIRLKSLNSTPIFNGVLQTQLLTSYSCIQRSGFSVSQGNTSTNTFTQIAATTYYFIPSELPDPVAGGPFDPICHDFVNYLSDGPNVPRYREQAAFSLFNKNEVLFYDNEEANGDFTATGNGVLDIEDRIALEYGSAVSGLFYELRWPTGPTANSSTTTTNPLLGFILTPFIDNTNNGLAFCPDHSDYQNTSDPLSGILGNYIGVETEPLYLAEKVRDVMQEYDQNGLPLPTTTLGPADYILVTESDINGIRYFNNNGVPTIPSNSDLINQTIQFHWPANYSSPFVRNSGQSVYHIRHPSELGTDEAPGVPRNNRPPGNRIIGCVPKL